MAWVPWAASQGFNIASYGSAALNFLYHGTQWAQKHRSDIYRYHRIYRDMRRALRYRHQYNPKQKHYGRGRGHSYLTFKSKVRRKGNTYVYK